MYNSCFSRSVYSWQPNSDQTNFFVEFNDSESAEHARHCETPATKISLLRDRRDLISRFTALATQLPAPVDVKPEPHDKNIPTLSSDNRPRKRQNPVARAYSGKLSLYAL